MQSNNIIYEEFIKFTFSFSVKGGFVYSDRILYSLPCISVDGLKGLVGVANNLIGDLGLNLMATHIFGGIKVTAKK